MKKEDVIENLKKILKVEKDYKTKEDIRLYVHINKMTSSVH